MVIKKRNVFTINSTVRLIEILMAIPLLVACGDENGNQSQSPEMPQREVVSYDELGYCTTDREGDSIFVASQSTDYLCINNNWIDITNVQISSSFGVNPVYSSSGIETITSSSSIFFFSSSEIKQFNSSSSIAKKTTNSSSSSVIIKSSDNNSSSSSSNSICMEVNAKGSLGGKCNSTNIGLCAFARADSSYHICRAKGWDLANKIEIDTYQWSNGKDGEIKKGNVTSTYYIFEKNKWSEAKKETALGLCTANNQGEVKKYVEYDISYFICDDGNWREASVIEYDTYEWDAGKDGEVRAGSVKPTNYYVYEDGIWRKAADYIEKQYGACVASRESEKISTGGKYFTCENKKWKEISIKIFVLGYCTAANEGTTGRIDTMYYSCENGDWTEIPAKEYELGPCSKNYVGIIKKWNEEYYICRSEWYKMTTLEYDTYGKVCSADGSIVDGEVITENKYVCDSTTSKGVFFRKATEIEISLEKGCTGYTVEDEIRKQISENQDSIYRCPNQNSVWDGTIGDHVTIGSFIDERDNKTYKSVTIGEQTWMAENLRYRKTGSSCYTNIELCENAKMTWGLYYTWSGAMDACPEGWHLPSREEFETLISAVGGQSVAGKMLKSSTRWEANNGADSYSFTAFPAGYGYGSSYNGIGEYAHFWSSTELDKNKAYGLSLQAYETYTECALSNCARYSNRAYIDESPKKDEYSVRCVKD